MLMELMLGNLVLAVSTVRLFRGQLCEDVAFGELEVLGSSGRGLFQSDMYSSGGSEENQRIFGSP